MNNVARVEVLFRFLCMSVLLLSGCDGGTSGFDPIPSESAIIDGVRRDGECQEHLNLTICRAQQTPVLPTAPTTATPTCTNTPTPTNATTIPGLATPTATGRPATPPAPTRTPPTFPTPNPEPRAPGIGVDLLGGLVLVQCVPTGGRIRCDFDLTFAAVDFIGGVSFHVAARDLNSNEPWSVSGPASLHGSGSEDDDNDGLPNCIDACPGDPSNACSDPCLLDTDGDGLADCSDPCPGDPRGAEDLDADGNPNCTDPCPVDPADACIDVCARDSDADGFADCEEICPFDPGFDPDRDGDGLPDCLDPCPEESSQECNDFRDRDGDGLPDFLDFCPDDPDDQCFDNCGADFDGDGAPFCVDPCPADPLDQCQNPCALDSDSDGIKDCQDPCPFSAEFAVRTTLLLNIDHQQPTALLELAILAFFDTEQPVPSQVSELGETGAGFAFVTDILEVPTR